jgi:hypothetical protein
MNFFRAVITMAGLAAVCASGQTQTPVFSTGQAARIVVGQVNFTEADYGATSTLIGSPAGVAYANGVLWVVDANRLAATPSNNRVLRFSDTSTYPTPTEDPTVFGSTCGVCRGKASLVLGQPDFVSSDASGGPSGMRNPTGVATDGTVLVVADTDNNRVLIWLTLPETNGQPADVVVGQPNFSQVTTTVPPTATSLRGPEGVWVANGKLYIADTQNNRILIYNKIPTTNGAAADVVIGQPNFTTFVQIDLTKATQNPTAANMEDPVSVTTDGQRMYVSDLGQNRVLIYNTIPTTNGASADVAVGQPNMTSSISNYVYVGPVYPASPTYDADGNPEGLTPELCQSNGTDSDGTLLWPDRCAATLAFPRYAYSDGTRLFISDGGNDRILIFNTIPTASGTRADIILGEPDEFSDNTDENPDGTDAFQTPTGFAWDSVNQNLYVSDTFNRRVTIFSPGIANVPLGNVRNAASLYIYAIGSVVIGGTINAKDTVSITVDSATYTYTVVSTDTLETITDNLVNLINKAPDPNVIASADDTTDTVILTAIVAGANGANITYSTSVSANAQVTAGPAGTNLSIYLQNPTSIAPGTVIVIYGQSLCDSTGTGDLTQTYLPFTLANCQVYVDGVRVPLLYVSPTQINAQMPWYVTDRTSISLYVRDIHADGSISVTSPVPVTIPPQNPGIFAQNGNDPRPALIYHGSSYAIDTVFISGTILAGDIGTITVGNSTYSYTVQSTDTLYTIETALINLINGGHDPNVTASAVDEYNEILLTAILPGPAGEGTSITAAVSGTNATPGLALSANNTVMCCDNIEGAPVTNANPAQPGEILYLLATGLGVTSQNDQDTGQVFQSTAPHPPAYPIDSIIAGGTSAQLISTSLVPGTVGVYWVQIQLAYNQADDLLTQFHIGQQSNVSNIVTFPVVAPVSNVVPYPTLPALRRRGMASNKTQ